MDDIEKLIVETGCCVLEIMCKTGDNKIFWNPNNQVEVDVARAAFDKATTNGYVAYKLTRDGVNGDRIKAFDKSIERMVLVPPIAGGAV